MSKSLHTGRNIRILAWSLLCFFRMRFFQLKPLGYYTTSPNSASTRSLTLTLTLCESQHGLRAPLHSLFIPSPARAQSSTASACSVPPAYLKPNHTACAPRGPESRCSLGPLLGGRRLCLPGHGQANLNPGQIPNPIIRQIPEIPGPRGPLVDGPYNVSCFPRRVRPAGL
jgi:hypothetical protein